ncbi:glycosylphosphatidylinositol-anchored high density lipoprotein-binding protein 1 isoform X1 [Saccopteryx bilineata]|uniref:glycosylphosphatidylinositol-anchored high density lipoprotein-binding protein 1 isoform X1 n=2 Tax=Saccopteryx bilineata TaxID=59482 RepID=UPI00338E07D8
MLFVTLPTDPGTQQDRAQTHGPCRMKTLMALLLALLLCRQPGRGQVQDNQDNDDDLGLEEEEEEDDEYDKEDEEEEEDEEAGMTAGSRDRGLQCYSCQSLHKGERCNRTHRCPLGHSFCKTIISQGETESGPLTTFAVWCADTCEPVTRNVGGTQVTMTCCQTSLCNIPPWQGQLGGGARGPQGSRAGDPQGGPETVLTTLLLSLLLSLGAIGC